MSIKSLITDPSTGIQAAVDDSLGTEDSSLVVATREHKTYVNCIKFFTNTIYGIDMNKSVTFGGTSVLVHDGIDTIAWTASAIAGTWDFNSGTTYYTDTHSVDATSTLNNSEAHFQSGSSIPMDYYTAISGYVNINSWPVAGTKGILLYTWDNNQIGDVVNIADYVDTNKFTTWQKFVIPKADLNLSGVTIDSIRIRTVAIGSNPPDYYIDELAIEETGTPLEYIVEPDRGTWFYVDSVRTTIADSYDTIVADGTVPAIAFDSILGVDELHVGVVQQRIQCNEICSNTVKQISDWLKFPLTTIDSFISDGTKSLITINNQYSYPEVLKFEEQDKLKVIINDDLSGLSMFTMCVSGKVEVRSKA